jgi:UDP-N-acetylglucosamine 2-epimerase (non-hydrolysing)
MTMPEEINRLVTDRLSDLLLTPDRLSGENLLKEGVPEKKIRFVGNIMIDTLEANRNKASVVLLHDILERNILISNKSLPVLKNDHYTLLTLHRPTNVDEREVLTSIVHFLTCEVTKDMPLIWPLHPRAEKQLKLFGLLEEVKASANIVLLHPLSYHDMLRLNMGAKVLLTDSGGLQEESTILGTSCLALRLNTERPITLRQHGGACVLVGNNIDLIRSEYKAALNKPRNFMRPELWDGHTAERCLMAILEY